MLGSPRKLVAWKKTSAPPRVPESGEDCEEPRFEPPVIDPERLAPVWAKVTENTERTPNLSSTMAPVQGPLTFAWPNRETATKKQAMAGRRIVTGFRSTAGSAGECAVRCTTQ